MLIEVHFVAQIDVDDIAFSCEVRWEVTGNASVCARAHMREGTYATYTDIA